MVKAVVPVRIVARLARLCAPHRELGWGIREDLTPLIRADRRPPNSVAEEVVRRGEVREHVDNDLTRKDVELGRNVTPEENWRSHQVAP
jgi:hypothetical protein